jgi:TRAP-type C4-dicarboxylate transport system permease large subunit
MPAAEVASARACSPEMDREGYTRTVKAALIPSASTMANLIPPSGD